MKCFRAKKRGHGHIFDVSTQLVYIPNTQSGDQYMRTGSTQGEGKERSLYLNTPFKKRQDDRYIDR